MHLSSYAKDKFIAPEMSEFTSANIRDMSAISSQQEHWLANFIVNSIFRSSMNSPARQQIYNFLRRSHAAFAEYALARESTLDFLKDRKNLRYVDAIGHWEAFLAYTWQAHRFLGQGKNVWFRSGDGSPLQRVNALHTRAKHADEALERGQFIGDSPLCVWLTNDGLRSTDTSISFAEMAEILEELARCADTVQDPRAIYEGQQ